MKTLPISWNTLILKPLFLTLVITIAFLPTFYCLYAYFQKSQSIEELNSDYEALKPKICKALTNRNTESNFMNLYADSDHFFTEKHLEKHQFMQSEISELKFLANYASFAKCTSLQQRLNYLTQGQNHLRLSPQQSHTCRLIHEVEEKLLNPIEVDREDLCKLLVYIEGIPFKAIQVPQGRPSMQLTHFKLQKKARFHGHNAYLIDFALVKREPASYKERT